MTDSPRGTPVHCFGKRRVLLVSFSESETAFLSRIAKILALTANWECSLLLLHEVTKNNAVIAELKTIGVEVSYISEWDFYNDNIDLESTLFLDRSYARLLQWWREKKTERLNLHLLVPLIRAGLFVAWFFVRFIPWLLRYGIKIVIRKAYKKIKETLRSKHPALFRRIRHHVLNLQSLWFEISWISAHNLRINKKHEIVRLRKYGAAVSRFLETQMPSILILAKDSAYYSTTIFVHAARSMGVPSVVIPYDRADTETLAKDRLGHPHHVIRSYAAREISAKFPTWVYTHDGHPLLLVAPATVFALEELDLAPPNPWGYNSSCCEKIFLETEEDRQLFLKSGASANQLVVIGAPYMDNLDEMLSKRDRLRAELCCSFGFQPTKPFVVASVPPNKVSQRTTEIEFQNYHTLIEKWSVALVKNLDSNLIYSLHPLTDPAEVSFIEKIGGKILQRPLEELLAAADMYVVDCSSTARWALYAGLDVIDYDVYRYDLWFNSDIKGVRHITSYEQFLVELTAARERLQDVRNRIPKSGYQPPVRKFGERLHLELENLLNSHNCKVRNVV